MLLSLSNELLILPYIVINVANHLNIIDSMKAVAENIYHCIQKHTVFDMQRDYYRITINCLSYQSHCFIIIKELLYF